MNTFTINGYLKSNFRSLKNSVRNLDYKATIHKLKLISKIPKGSSSPLNYINFSELLILEKQMIKATQLLIEGKEKFPGNHKIVEKLADLYITQKNWAQAVGELQELERRENRKAPPQLYNKLGKTFRFLKNAAEAERYLLIGNSQFPYHKGILFELAEVAMLNKNWKLAEQRWQTLIDHHQENSQPRAFIRQSLVQRKLKNPKKAGEVLLAGMAFYPEDDTLKKESAEIAISLKDWPIAIERLSSIKRDTTKPLYFKAALDLALLNQMQGNKNEADDLFDMCFEQHPLETKSLYSAGYRKLVLFDNGESRIEYYKKLNKTNTLCITYDSINITWNRTPFGFAFLSKQDIDIIAVRRRKSTNYQQDLSKEDFLDTVTNLTQMYTKVISYGFSLGAYSALYYGSSISTDIVSFSPRNSIHPIYGKKRNSKHKFQHALTLDPNPMISPIIVFDPKNIIDQQYIENEVLKAYPNATLVKCPFTGHNTAGYFSQIGHLKEFVLNALNGKELPNMDRKQKIKSHSYLTSLGNFCFKRNKIKWADELVEQALKLSPLDETANLLKIQVIAKLHGLEDGIQIAEKTLQLLPDSQKVNLQFIDLLIENDNLSSAKTAIEHAITKFPTTQIFKEKLKKAEAELTITA